MKYPLVQVEWLDSNLQSGWAYLSMATRIRDIQKQFGCISTGYLIADEDDYIIIAPHIDEAETQVNGSMTIPSGVVTKISRIEFNSEEEKEKG